MHNGDLANPFNKWSREIKKISSKRKKTDSDFEEMARLEFHGALYMGEDGPIIPADCIYACIHNGAKKERMGPTMLGGIFVEEHASLEYEGPRTTEDLWAEESFRYQVMVNVQRSKVLRTRVIFDSWSAVVRVKYEDSIVNSGQVDGWMMRAGYEVGLMARRPRFGRFTVEVLDEKTYTPSFNGQAVEKVPVG